MAGLSHHLHGGYSHPVLREWHDRNDNLLYPLFITSDPNGQETIPGLDGIYRWGLNKITTHLDDLVNNFNLKSVLLFAVDKVSTRDETGTQGVETRVEILVFFIYYFFIIFFLESMRNVPISTRCVHVPSR